MLELKKVKIGYNGQSINDNINLQLKASEQCLIIGESGCGKTTLLHTIAALTKPIEGKIIINNTEITKLSESASDIFRGQNIGIIFQKLHLVKSLNVLDNLLLSPYFSDLKQDKNLALKTLKNLNIENLAIKLPENLSQGQAQRLAIARAILHKPTLILADEPTSGLDDKNCEIAINLIKETAQKNKAILIIVTHDNRLRKHFDKVINMEVK